MAIPHERREAQIAQDRRNQYRQIPAETVRMLLDHARWLNNPSVGRRLDDPRMDLRGLDLSGVTLSSARLPGALLDESNLASAKLDGADLSNASLMYCVVDGANFRGADLRCACVLGTDLGTATRDGARLDGVQRTEEDLWAVIEQQYDSFCREHPNSGVTIEEFAAEAANRSEQRRARKPTSDPEP